MNSRLPTDIIYIDSELKLLKLKVLNGDFSICKIKDIKDVNFNDEFFFVGKTDEEISLACKTEFVPNDCIAADDGWKGLRIEDALDLSLVGIIAEISAILAANDIAVFVISTFNTDYALVKSDDLTSAVSSLQDEGYVFS